MGIKVVKIKFQAPVHFGDGRLSDSRYSADASTLFSAMYIEALRIGTANELLNAVLSGDMLISDMFPYIGETYYLPKPIPTPAQAYEVSSGEKANSVMRKAYNKLRYLPVEKVRSYLSGEYDITKEKIDFNLGAEGMQTKVNLEREESINAEPYHVGFFSYSDDAGIYFILKGDYEIIPLLDSLIYSGLGGKRSSGYGRFDYSIDDVKSINDLFDSQGNKKILLASSVPTESELTDSLIEGASYALKKNSGFIQSATHSDVSVKKKDFYTFTAGSVFAKKFTGDIFDVSPGGSHSVYRYAKAMWIEV